jgi:hypothetical protein
MTLLYSGLNRTPLECTMSFAPIKMPRGRQFCPLLSLTAPVLAGWLERGAVYFFACIYAKPSNRWPVLLALLASTR